MTLGIYLVETDIGSAVILADPIKEISDEATAKLLASLGMGDIKNVQGTLIGWSLLNERPRVVCVSRTT